MAKARTTWVDDLTAEQREMLRALVADARTPAAHIYRELRLVRYLKPAHFRRWVREQRLAGERPERQITGRETGATGSTGQETGATGTGATVRPGPQPAPTPEALIAASLSALHTAIINQEVPEYALPKVITALAGLQKLAIDEAAEQRAAELHEVKLRELREKQEQALQKLTAGGDAHATLTAEQVAEIRSKVLGL